MGSIERVEAQISWDFEEPIDVAGDPYGNKCPRLVLDAEDNPVVFMGKNNDGLYVATSQNGVFNAPQPVPTDPGIFLSDAEGPDVATWGNTIGLAYQIAGQWATGAQYMVSEDGGVSWSPSYAIAPNATEDHFMPIPAFDENGNPFVGLKLGSGNSAQEGVLRSMDGGMTWGPAESASFAAGNGIACECCPSRTVYGNGRYYSIYRRNNNNIRDMWLVSSVDGVVWDQQLDLDPTDWQINACPETGTSAAWLPDGRLASVFMSAGNGSSQVYLNVSDPVADDAGSTTALSATQFSTIIKTSPTSLWAQPIQRWSGNKVQAAGKFNCPSHQTMPCQVGWWMSPSLCRNPCRVPIATPMWPSMATPCMSFGKTARTALSNIFGARSMGLLASKTTPKTHPKHA